MFRMIESLESRLMLADARLVKDIFVGPDRGAYGNSVSAVNGKLYFTGIDATAGWEPWISDGDPNNTTMLKDVAPGPSFTGPSSFMAGNNGKVFFAVSDGARKSEIWVTDGTTANTHKVSAAPTDAVAVGIVNGNVLFTDFNVDGLYKTDEAGGQVLLNAQLHAVQNLGVAGGKLFFYARNASDESGLWYTNGTSAVFVTDIDPDIDIENVTKGVALGSNLIFGASVFGKGEELFVTNGASAGTHRVAAEINLKPFDGSDPRYFTVSGGSVYFTATDGTNSQIYKTNGTTWTKVTTLAGTVNSGDIRELIDVNGTLYFSYAGTGVTRRLYKLVNGTTATPVGTIAGGIDGGTQPAYITAVGNTVYFSGIDNQGKARLFESDGTTITKVGGDSGLNPTSLTNVNGTLFFIADDDAHGEELHKVVAPRSTPIDVTLVKTEGDGVQDGVTKEGQFVSYEARTDPSVHIVKYLWDFEGNGKWVKGPGLGASHIYVDDFHSVTARSIRVKVFDEDGNKGTASVKLLVLNVPPTVKIRTPSKLWTAWTPFWATVTVTDPGKNDPITFDVAWGDGKVSAPQPIKTIGRGTATNTYFSAGAYPIVAHGYDGADNSVGDDKTAVVIGSVTTASNFGSGIVKGLLIGANKKNARIKVAPRQSTSGGNGHGFTRSKPRTAIEVFVDGQSQGVYNMLATDTIQVYGSDGADRIEIDPSLALNTVIYGGAGNDTIFGGAGNDFIVGGAGTDKIYGNGGVNRIKA